MRVPPPKKRPGQGRGPRTVNGLALDVRSAAGLIGMSEKQMRGLVSRRLIPFRRLSGRIILLRQELEHWLACLDGCGLEEVRANHAMRQGGKSSA